MQLLTKILLKLVKHILRPVLKIMDNPILVGIISGINTEIIRSKLLKCGKNIYVQHPISIEGHKQISFGNNIAFAAFVHIWGSGGVEIHDNVMIGTHTSITSLTHDYSKLIMFGTTLSKKVIISENVWIGSNCIILPGVIIGEGSVIGAGSVVTRNVEPFSIVAGNPARIIKKRIINED